MAASKKKNEVIEEIKLASECKKCGRYKGNNGACGGRNSLVNMCIAFVATAN